MAVRYFERVTVAGDKVALFRLNVDEVQREIVEDAWTDGTWTPTTRLVEYLFDGSTEIVEVNERDAMRDFPDALTSRVAKTITPTFTLKHLAGQHDQRTHGSGGGSVYGGAFRARFDDEETFAFDVDEEGMVDFLVSQKSAHSKVTPQQATSVITYQAEGDYEQINDGLRMEAVTGDRTELSAEHRKVVQDVDTAIANHSFSEDVTVFRGIRDDGLYGERLADLNVGDEFADPAFSSTTLNPMLAFNFTMDAGGASPNAGQVLMRINVPKGKPALAADPATSRLVSGKDKIEMFPDQTLVQGFSVSNEVILPRGSLMQVTGKSVIDGVTVLEVTYQ